MPPSTCRRPGQAGHHRRTGDPQGHRVLTQQADQIPRLDGAQPAGLEAGTCRAGSVQVFGVTHRGTQSQDHDISLPALVCQPLGILLPVLAMEQDEFAYPPYVAFLGPVGIMPPAQHVSHLIKQSPRTIPCVHLSLYPSIYHSPDPAAATYSNRGLRSQFPYIKPKTFY